MPAPVDRVTTAQGRFAKKPFQNVVSRLSHLKNDKMRLLSEFLKQPLLLHFIHRGVQLWNQITLVRATGQSPSSVLDTLPILPFIHFYPSLTTSGAATDRGRQRSPPSARSRSPVSTSSPPGSAQHLEGGGAEAGADPADDCA